MVKKSKQQLASSPTLVKQLESPACLLVLTQRIMAMQPQRLKAIRWVRLRLLRRFHKQHLITLSRLPMLKSQRNKLTFKQICQHSGMGHRRLPRTQRSNKICHWEILVAWQLAFRMQVWCGQDIATMWRGRMARVMQRWRQLQRQLLTFGTVLRTPLDQRIVLRKHGRSTTWQTHSKPICMCNILHHQAVVGFLQEAVHYMRQPLVLQVVAFRLPQLTHRLQRLLGIVMSSMDRIISPIQRWAQPSQRTVLIVRITRQRMRQHKTFGCTTIQRCNLLVWWLMQIRR